MKKVAFVTGANGFVGSHLVELLVKKGMEVHCLLRASSDDKWLRGLDITIHRGGIEDVQFLNRVFHTHRANYVFHLAGTVKAFDYAGFEAGNVHPTRCILEASVHVPSIEKIVITSSLAASCATTIGSPNDESCPRNPLTDYGKSKVAQEDVARSYMDRLPIAIIRPPVVYGERDVEVYLFFKTIQWHIVPLIGFSPKAISLVHVSDLVDGFYLAGVSDTSSGQTYFLGGVREQYSWEELGNLASEILQVWTIQLRVPHTLVFLIAYIYEFISNHSGKAVALNIQKAREMVSESWSCTSRKAMKELGYNPKTDIQAGFRKTIAWYKERGWL